ncbi:MAG TPA: YHS domain-containing (seleno)protein [Dongiaceae bacterium]|nr:YHS domain-containing (seleno)protein [Dongiaceae bacterium]
MQSAIARWVGILFVALSLQTANADSTHVAVQGYDVVAYFTEGKAVKGSPSYELPFDDATWQFANVSHKEMFAADPDRYLPQYGGMCAGGMAFGVSVPANPENWVIVDGKLYILSGSPADLADWKAHAAENIKAADKIWAKHAY